MIAKKEGGENVRFRGRRRCYSYLVRSCTTQSRTGSLRIKMEVGLETGFPAGREYEVPWTRLSPDGTNNKAPPPQVHYHEEIWTMHASASAGRGFVSLAGGANAKGTE